jgi:hypothetical protein
MLIRYYTFFESSIKTTAGTFPVRGRAGDAVRTKGLEPPRRVAPDPKSGASTNSATSAKTGRKDN